MSVVAGVGGGYIPVVDGQKDLQNMEAKLEELNEELANQSSESQGEGKVNFANSISPDSE